jgi:uncharacterized damage-inducible protein DinB
LKRTSLSIATVLFTAAALLPAQDNSLSAENKMIYNLVKGNIIKAAEKMPEANYSFQPTPDIRTFGQIIGHVADSQYSFCSAVKGEKKSLGIEKSQTTKADLVAALKDSFAYCDAVYDSMTDASVKEKVAFFGGQRSKLSVLYFNSAHNDEHYGNMVTYMRLKGLVPPSSEMQGK